MLGTALSQTRLNEMPAPVGAGFEYGKGVMDSAVSCSGRGLTIDHCIEDQEWGDVEETLEVTEGEGSSADFCRAGGSRLIDHAGSMREEPL